MASQASLELNDLVIIGAGWFGLSCAKAYLQIHPDHSVVLLESALSSGGTWSSDRIYPHLVSNNLYGGYEHPDFPMDEKTYGVKDGEHIPGLVLHRYLTDFAKKFGVYEHIRFNSQVESVESGRNDGWVVKISREGEKQEVIETKKLIVACGLTSTPNLPRYPGQENFTPPFFHSRDFGKNREMVDTAERVVVVGGAKSAFDITYAFANGAKNLTVDMIIREGGRGPVWLCPAHVTPWKRKIEELFHTRFLTWFSPCPWSAEDGFGAIQRFLHSTWLGRFFVSGFWKALSNNVVNLNGYDSRPRLKALKPWTAAFQSGSKVSINNYPTNFFDLVDSGKVRIHTTDIGLLSGNTVHLRNGEILETDLVVCATGWKRDPTFPITVPGPYGFGLPYSPEEQIKLNAQYDAQISAMFPSLNTSKQQYSLKASSSILPPTEPLRLYRFLIPPTLIQRRTLAFAGMTATVSTSEFAAVQGLWITAFFDGKLDRIPESNEDMTKDVMLHTQWVKASFPDFAFDALFYIDMLLNDLSLKNHRKKGILAELFQPYRPVDYKGLVEEWQEVQAKKDESIVKTGCDKV